MNSFDVFSKMSTTIDRELFSTCHKDHKCKYCGKTLYDSDSKMHLQNVHKGFKKYKCDEYTIHEK